jgi:hypothetical protein
MKKIEPCSYCQKRRKTYRCEGMLTVHCKECCAFNCSGKKVLSLLDASFKWARDMGGASWPSADCTRSAMAHLAAGIASHFEKIAKKKPMNPQMIAKEMLRACGLLKPKRAPSLTVLVKDTEALLK